MIVEAIYKPVYLGKGVTNMYSKTKFGSDMYIVLHLQN